MAHDTMLVHPDSLVARHTRGRATVARVIVADDQADALEALRLLLKSEGYHLETVSSPAGLLAALEARDFDVVLMDLNYARDTTSGEEGLDLLIRIQRLDPTLPVVVMTAWSSVELAVEAMRRGARDFVQKPWDNARLMAIVRTQIELSQALRRGRRLEAENRLLRGESRPRVVAESPAVGRLEDMSLEDVERFLIKKAMTRFGKNVSQAAKALGLSRSALYRRLQRYGL